MYVHPIPVFCYNQVPKKGTGAEVPSFWFFAIGTGSPVPVPR